MGKKDKKKEKEEDVKEEEEDALKDSDDEPEEEYKWWKDENLVIRGKGERQWDTLVHNGPMFPDPYVPHGIPIEYNGVPFHMTPEEEEVATMFAQMKTTDYYRSEIFRRNFWGEWKAILDKRGEHPIRSLANCNFEPIYQWWSAQREAKKNRSKEEKKKAKEEENKRVEPYKFCLWDGRKQELAAYRIEPPGLFRGRGKHPLQGKLKRRIQPEDVTINIGEDAPVPEPPAGHKWGAVQHDHDVTWLSMFRDTVGGNFKYMMLASSGATKQIFDREKFEKARRLKQHIDKIRETYMKEWDSSDSKTQKLAVAMYFIDKLALRVGNEKNEDEADTVGCCSLRWEHVVPQEHKPGNILHFDFLGKDSIQYENDVEVHPKVFELIKKFRRGRTIGADLFEGMNPSDLNKKLKEFMPDLTAKVFRTYNASFCLDDYFRQHPWDNNMTIHDKVAYFNEANTQVAILCNHQKTVSKGHEAAMEGLSAKDSYFKELYERLEKAAEVVKRGKQKEIEKCVEEFYRVEDEYQIKWLEEWGTEEEKAEYEAYMVKRGAKPPKTINVDPKEKSEKKKSSGKSSGKSKDKKAGKKRGREDDDEDEELAKIVKAKPTAKAAKGKQAKKEESDDEDAPPAKKQRKEAPKGKKGATVKEESDDDETPPPKSSRKGSPKKASPKKASPKKKAAAKKSPPKGKKGGKKAAEESDSDDDVPVADLM